jgi:hypothetical protein
MPSWHWQEQLHLLLLEFLTLEDGTGTLPRNVSIGLPFGTAEYSEERRSQTDTIRRASQEI